MLSNEIVEQLLLERGIPLEEHEVFLDPDFERDTHSPWLLAGMEVAVTRLAKARQEKIIIFGDYDTDGIPATALLLRVLKRFGFTDVEGVIPTREQGYGLTTEIVESLLAKKPALVLAVDNGTVAKAEVAALAAAGVDVIIIDHHEPQEGHIADKALAIINPKMEGCEYPFKEPCACALAWKVMLALSERLGEDSAQLKWELDLVALSTVADMVPLLGENRVLVKFGLKVLAKTRNLGLRALMDVAGVKDKPSAGDLGFKLGPRINATSRMHDELLDGEHVSLKLLTAESGEVARAMAERLNRQNGERQQLVDAHLVEAFAQVDDSHLVIIVFHEDWSTGVIGLVASRLLERYKRPVIALAPEGGVIKGSVRSVDGVHALELLESGREHLERFGGHTKAAGLTLIGSLEDFRQALLAHASSLDISLEALALAAERKPDLELKPIEVSLELAQGMEKLEPFGIGFPAPLIAIEAGVENVRKVGAEGKHVSFFIADAEASRKAIAFSYRGPELLEGEKYRFLVNLEAEEWREVVSPVCHVRRVEKLGYAFEDIASQDGGSDDSGDFFKE